MLGRALLPGLVLSTLGLFVACGDEDTRFDRRDAPDACADGACDAAACGQGGTGACEDAATPEDATVRPDADAAPDVDAEAAAPRCGDAQREGDEPCDDGNSVGGDGCENDCTLSVCDRDAATDGGTCASLDSAPYCATSGTRAGRLVRDLGVCSDSGCVAEQQLVDDCLDVQLPAPYCSGSAATGTLTHHFNARATCGGAPLACGVTDSTTTCAPGNPSCAAGQLTTYTATCSSASGCGRQANRPTSCSDPADQCSTVGGVATFTRYTPTCASATACGTPSAQASACTAAAPTCATAGGRPARRTYTPACNPAGTACATPGTPTDSPCSTSAGSCGGTPAAATTYTATCTGAGVCGQTASTSPCADTPSTCTRNPTNAVLQLTSYTPTCAGTVCGTPVSSTRTCAGSYTCAGRTLEYRPPACVAATDYCGPATTVTSSQDCAALDSALCTEGRLQDTLTRTIGVCTPGVGQCGTTTTTSYCPKFNTCRDAQTLTENGGCANGNGACVSRDRQCSRTYCVGADLHEETGCVDGACREVVTRGGCPTLPPF